MSEADQRISLSRETLRAELTALELRLVDRLTLELKTKADVATVTSFESRLQSLEISRANREHLVADVVDLRNRVVAMENEIPVSSVNDHETRLRDLERFKNAVPAASILAILVSVVAVVVPFIYSGH